MTVKAILVAGGYGSRLHPFTHYTQKTLLPLYNRPVIDYALGTIRRAGIKDITIISNRFVDQIASHVGQGLPGERIHYVIEEEPLGVAHALNLARPYNENARLMVYFSDNITTVEFGQHVANFSAADTPPGCLLIAREETHLEAFGVAVMDEKEQSAILWRSLRTRRQTLPSVASTCLMSASGISWTAPPRNKEMHSPSPTSPALM